MHQGWDGLQGHTKSCKDGEPRTQPVGNRVEAKPAALPLERTSDYLYLCPRQLRQKFARIPDSFWVLPQTSGSGVSSRTVVRATAVKSPVFPQCSQSAGVIGRLYACVGTTRQPFGPRVLTRAAGTFCNPCLRAGPTDQWRPRAE